METDRTNPILDCEARLLDAMRTSNVAELDALLHDDLLFHTPDGMTATKGMDLDNYRSGGVRLHMVTATDRTVRVFGETAVVSVTVRLAGIYLTIALDGLFQYLRVWQYTDDGWRVIAGSVVPFSGMEIEAGVKK